MTANVLRNYINDVTAGNSLDMKTAFCQIIISINLAIVKYVYIFPN